MASVDPAVPVARPRRRGVLLRFALDQPLGTAGALVIVALALAALFAEWVAPYDPLEIDFLSLLQAPSAAHLMGTDSVGRDVFTRILYGARTALAIGCTASFVGGSIGALIGIASAYFGGLFDLIVQRVVDVMLVFPIIILALVIVAMLGRGGPFDLTVIAAIAIPIVPHVARVIRAAALVVREMPYVDAARAAGYSHARIILRHMAPNVMAPYLILLTAYVAQAILLEASLSFLGLGVNEPQPAWGLMLSGAGAQFYREAPWLVFFPGLAISLAVFAFNLFGDALRDWLDPKFRT
jgi:peptide/nickel transport system permease protein